MTNFEVFSGLDQGDKMDPGAFERFKEQMKANAAQIKALQKAEQKQKKKEGKLVKILLRFIQSSQKTDLVMLISRCLELNIPAEFLLSVVLLGNEDIQEETGVKLALPVGDSGDSDVKNDVQEESDEYSQGVFPIENERREIVTHADIAKVLPLKIRIQIDLWGKNLFESAQGIPHKILHTVLVQRTRVPSWYLSTFSDDADESNDENSKKNEEKIQPMLIRLTAHVLHEFLQGHGIESDVTAIKEFAEFILHGVVEKVKNQVEGQAVIPDSTHGAKRSASPLIGES